MAIADGPDESLLGGAKPEGRPSTSVLRPPVSGTKIEMRPVLTPFPPSLTSKSPLVEKIILVGERRPPTRFGTGHCAVATVAPSPITAAMVNAVRNILSFMELLLPNRF